MMYFFVWVYKWIRNRERESDLERQPDENMEVYLQRVMDEWDKTFKEGHIKWLHEED